MRTMKCPNCGKSAIEHMTDIVLMSNPPQRECRWYCRCGYDAHSRYEALTKNTHTLDEIWYSANLQHGVSR